MKWKMLAILVALILFYNFSSTPSPTQGTPKRIVPKKVMKVSTTRIREKIKSTPLEVVSHRTGSSSIEPYPSSSFKGISLRRDEILPWLKKGGIKSIRFMDKSKSHVITPKTNDGKSPAPAHLFISTDQSVTQLTQERLHSFSPTGLYAPNPKKNVPLNLDDYEIIRFNPGLRDDRVTLISQDKDLEKAVHGPDFSLESVDPEDTAGLEKLRSKVLSLGHGGELVLKIKDNGYISDGPGADFIIYENPFRFGEGKIYQEFAYVGVAFTDDPNDYRWFKCDPLKMSLKGCGGVVPTDEGGDHFDLGQLGLKKVRYIKIKDFGENFNLGENTEGFDLDALQLINAYKEI